MSDDDMARAVAALDSLPADTPMGEWIGPDGSLAGTVTAADVRQALLDGEHTPQSVLSQVAFARWATAQSANPTEASVGDSLPFYFWEVGLRDLPGVGP